MDTTCRYLRGVKISPKHRITDFELAIMFWHFLFANSNANANNANANNANNVSATSSRIGFQVNVNKTKVLYTGS